jgi:hypothetical protein
MLNQAIAGMVPVSNPMVELVAAVRAKIPRLVDAFKNQRSIATNDDILRLMKLADTLAAERKPAPVSASVVTAPVQSKQHVSSFEFDLRLERCMQRADEALHRSEMALQQARRIADQNEVQRNTPGKSDCSAEMEQMNERLKTLAKEVSDVQREYENSQVEPILYQGEMDQLFERRMRESLLPMEFLRVELKQDMDENRRAVTSLRRSWWLALTLSSLVGGAVATGLIISVLSLG